MTPSLVCTCLLTWLPTNWGDFGIYNLYGASYFRLIYLKKYSLSQEKFNLGFFSDQTSSICKCNWLLSRVIIACYIYSASCTDGPSRDRVFFANLLAKNSSVSSLYVLLAGQWHWWIGLDFSNCIKKIFLILYTSTNNEKLESFW